MRSVKIHKKRTSRSHDEAMIEMLHADPAFANDYICMALEEADEPGGREALLIALRQVAEACGMAKVAKLAGIKREALYRALSPKGNPTLKTLNAVLDAVGLKLAVERKKAA